MKPKQAVEILNLKPSVQWLQSYDSWGKTTKPNQNKKPPRF